MDSVAPLHELLEAALVTRSSAPEPGPAPTAWLAETGPLDTLYRLHLDNLTSLELAEWRSKQDSINRCAQKNQLP
ncbi:hypothetical protein PoB_001972700, partial [Plakobranchus ocellatus]